MHGLPFLTSISSGSTVKRATALCHGAATAVNAIPAGKGAAFGIALETRATIRLERGVGKVHVRMAGHTGEPDRLVAECVRRVLAHAGEKGRWDAEVLTNSTIPVSKGLKSSSAAANAATLATAEAAGADLSDMEAVGIGVDAAVAAGVTLTGAYDDACATCFGGLVVTDNGERKILMRRRMDPHLRVAVHIPPFTIRKRPEIGMRLRAAALPATAAHELVLKGRWKEALVINGLACSAALCLDPAPAVRALAAGAVAAGLSGTGPATVAVVSPKRLAAVTASWKGLPGRVITTRLNHRKAGVVTPSRRPSR